MKKKVIAAISLATLLCIAGCGANKEVSNIIGGADEPTSIFVASKVDDEGEKDIFSGFWQTASMGHEFYGTYQPMYYVKFDGWEIHYGHMKDEEFVEEFTDEISSLDEFEAGRYIIKAQTESGAKYTYYTSEEDKNILEYFGTWDEDDYLETYSGSSSLLRCQDAEILFEEP
jgi:hypothetical protein